MLEGWLHCVAAAPANRVVQNQQRQTPTRQARPVFRASTTCSSQTPRSVLAQDMQITGLPLPPDVSILGSRISARKRRYCGSLGSIKGLWENNQPFCPACNGNLDAVFEAGTTWQKWDCNFCSFCSPHCALVRQWCMGGDVYAWIVFVDF